MIEAGLPGYEVSLLFAVVMPAGTPAPIVARLNREIGEIMATPDVKRVLAAQAIQVDVEHAGASCASASPRKSSCGAASPRRPASSRSDAQPAANFAGAAQRAALRTSCRRRSRGATA